MFIVIPVVLGAGGIFLELLFAALARTARPFSAFGPVGEGHIWAMWAVRGAHAAANHFFHWIPILAYLAFRRWSLWCGSNDDLILFPKINQLAAAVYLHRCALVILSVELAGKYGSLLYSLGFYSEPLAVKILAQTVCSSVLLNELELMASRWPPVGWTMASFLGVSGLLAYLLEGVGKFWFFFLLIARMRNAFLAILSSFVLLCVMRILLLVFCDWSLLGTVKSFPLRVDLESLGMACIWVVIGGVSALHWLRCERLPLDPASRV